MRSRLDEPGRRGAGQVRAVQVALLEPAPAQAGPEAEGRAVMEVSYLRAKPLRCRVGFHAWTKWALANDYRRYEPVAGTEGLIAIRNLQERRCGTCGERERELGKEHRLRPEEAIAVDLITEYERKNLRHRPLISGQEWWERRNEGMCGGPHAPLGWWAGLLCRVSIHRWSSLTGFCQTCDRARRW